jgi:hypothetical protein
MWWKIIRNLISNQRARVGPLELMSSMINMVVAGSGALA